MSNITIGLDLAKRIFHLCLMKGEEKVIYKKLKREEVLSYFESLENKHTTRHYD